MERLACPSRCDPRDRAPGVRARKLPDLAQFRQAVGRLKEAVEEGQNEDALVTTNNKVQFARRAMRVLLIAANTEQIGMITFPRGLEPVNVAVRLAGHESRVLDLIFEKPAAAVRNGQNLSNPRFLLESVRAIVAEYRLAKSVTVNG